MAAARSLPVTLAANNVITAGTISVGDATSSLIVPAVITLLAASVTVAVAPLPWPTANSFPPPTGIAPVPVVKLKFPRLLMFSVLRLRSGWSWNSPCPRESSRCSCRRLTFTVPVPGVEPTMFSVVLIAPRMFGVPTAKTLLVVAFRLVIGALLVTLRVDPLPIVSVFAAALLVDELKLPMVVLTPGAIVIEPVKSPVLVPVLGVPSVTPFAVDPTFPPAPIMSVPLLIATGPVKLLLPVRLSVPSPPRFKPALPTIGGVNWLGLAPSRR